MVPRPPRARPSAEGGDRLHEHVHEPRPVDVDAGLHVRGQPAQPFGIGHATPLFWSSRCRVVQQRQLRGGHLQLTLEQEGATARAIAWRWAGAWTLPNELDVAFHLRLNRWQGQEQLQLELKLLAEVGIIGLPNAGKSTLIAALSAARPRIADYPFTTLVPNLGVVRRPSGDGTVFADIPGLIAGAAQGAGLGHDFLRHIERTRLLVHLVEVCSDDVGADLAVVERELEAYGHGLAQRPRLLVLTKAEVVDGDTLQAALEQLQQPAQRLGATPVLVISAVTGQGLEALRAAVWQQLGIESD